MPSRAICAYKKNRTFGQGDIAELEPIDKYVLKRFFVPVTDANKADAINDEERVKKLLAEGDDDATIRFVKEKVLESYRNGIEVGKSTRKKTTKELA